MFAFGKYMGSILKFDPLSMSNMMNHHNHNSHQDSCYASPGMKLHQKRSCIYRLNHNECLNVLP